MELHRRLPQEIDETLGRGGTILTGNQRAARTLRLDFDRQRRAEGITSWQPPAIFAWDTWLASLWREILLYGRSDRLLLNRTQELHLWRSIISARSESGLQWSSLKSVDSLAAMAADAWQQLCRYRGQSRLDALGVSGDTRVFQRWAQAFVRRCKAGLFLSQSELESAITTSTFTPPVKELLLIGFDSLTPAQNTLLDTLGEAGVAITHQPFAPIGKELYLAAAKDLDEELTQAAFWLRRRLEAHPEDRIAVIHPGLAASGRADRAELDRVFRRVLAPELEDIAADPASGPYEFSLGQPLSQQPMVAIALKLLRWTVSPLPLDGISHVLLSPYFASRTSERHQRAEFDAFSLRHIELLRPELDLPSLIAQAELARAPAGLLRQLHGLQRTATKLRAGSKQRSFADSADNIRELLHAAAWANASPDSSVEFQTRRKWEGALDELATLDFEGARADFTQALDHLEQIAQLTLFAPESREAPIQIMGPQEAAGSRFDALYFLRASDLTWPTRPGLNPLLGWRLQRELHMPGSDAAQHAAHSQHITARLAASAPLAVFSYAQETADAHQRPSPTLTSLSLVPLPANPSPGAPARIPLETFRDSGNIPLLDPKVKGGSTVLKLQAACGFRAFAEKRLWSTVPESSEPGMDAAERGNIVHVALEELWQELRTRDKLRSLTSEQRTAALSRAIDLSLRKFKAAAASPWDTAYLDLQRQRLHRLLSAWLDLEITRPPFEVKLREQEYEDAAIGPLLLSLRVDRIDRVFNQEGEELGEVILDYKTGPASPSGWKGERPDEPQLPLYTALREPGTVAGIAFVSLRPGGSMGMCGLEAGQGVLLKAARHAFASLEEQIADWRRVLTALATSFADGDARVLPKAYPGTCKYCKQRILCRLDPTLLASSIDEASNETIDEATGESLDGALHEPIDWSSEADD